MVLEIKRINYGNSTLPESCVFPNGRADRSIPIVFSVFLIRTEQRTLLVDAGCDTMPGFEMEHFIGPVAALEREGYRAEEITDVIITHAHHDHMEAIGRFPQANVYLHRAEHRDALRRGLIPKGTRLVLFDSVLELEDGLRAVHVGGHSPGSCVVEAAADGKVYAVCGDECYSMQNIQKKIPTPSTCSPQNSRYFIDRYASNDYVCLLSHDE